MISDAKNVNQEIEYLNYKGPIDRLINPSPRFVHNPSFLIMIKYEIKWGYLYYIQSIIDKISRIVK